MGPGDTLARIADGYGVELGALARANGIDDVDRIRVGQRLVIPGGGRIVHRLRPGESLDDVARRYGVPVSTIARANGIADPARVEVGRRLVMPRGASLPPPPSAPDPAVEGARARLDEAVEAYRAARFDAALASAREAESLLDGRRDADPVRARAAFVGGAALAGLGDDEPARESFARARSLDPHFEPPEGWLSPRLEALYRAAAPD